MESGLVSDTGESWAGAYGLGVGTLGIGKHEKATTEDLSLNVKWNATERLYFEFDAQLTKADADYSEVWGGGTFLRERLHAAGPREPENPFRNRSAAGLQRRQHATGWNRQCADAHLDDGPERRVLAVCGRFLPRRHG